MPFIVFEGLDAAGKSTLMNRVERGIKDKGLELTLTQDPGTTELGVQLKNLILSTDGEAPVPKAELLLYQAARVQMVDLVIRPALKTGGWVLADRFYSSTLAFQVHARGLDGGMVHALNQYVAPDCGPDLFIFIDISVAESSRRKKERASDSGVGQDRMEQEAQDFQEQVRQGYLQQARLAPEKWLVLDGTMAPQDLSMAVFQCFKERQWLD